MAKKNLINSDTIGITTDGENILLNVIYPIGSIYMSVNNTNPSTFFGGTWEQWGSGKVPVGIDTNDTDFNTSEKTGGEKTHTLTVAEMPQHAHATPSIMYTGAGGLGYGDFRTEIAVNGTVDKNKNLSTTGTGGDQPHNNLQPYITCYMWKRVS